MTQTAYEIANSNSELMAFSPVALKLCEVIDDESSNASNIANVIKQDPALAARLLQLANSPFYGFSQEICEIEDAISRIGTTETFRIALSVSISNSFHDIPETLISKKDFWAHSTLCAYAAEELSDLYNIRSKGAIYTAGLLHDIGQLILFANYPDKSLQVLERCIDSHEELDQAEIEYAVFGFTHAQIGYELARKWNFPLMLQECIAYHHSPNEANNYRQEVLTINMSNILAILIEINSTNINDVPCINKNVHEEFNKTLNDITNVCERIEQKFLGAKNIILDSLTV